MNNVAHIKNCYGCGVCALACNRRLISIELDEDGFYAPQIADMERCTDCGLCTKVCSYQHDDVLTSHCEPKGFAAWSNNEDIRHRCSSGGVGYEIGRSLMRQGYKLCGVRYNAETNKAEHYIATTDEEWAASVGSKYIQSYTVEALDQIDRGGRYLITGTPCQIDSLRRYLRTFHAEENFVLMDFFCHGVPSKVMWDKYLSEVRKKIGAVASASWRSKGNGWNDSWVMTLQGCDGTHVSYRSKGDAFYQLFLGNQCLGKACYVHCKYKSLNSSADIRIGDLWGQAYQDNKEGVSALIGLTARGQQVIADTKDIERVTHDIDIVIEGQMSHKLSYPFIMRPIQLFLSKTRTSIVFQAMLSKFINKLKGRLHIQ